MINLDGRIQTYMDENFTGRRLLKETERGTVWLASDKAGCPVIIKQIHRTGLPYQKLKELAHPLWPGIRFVSESGTDTWVVEEYVSGKNLRDFKEDGHFLTENEARSILFRCLFPRFHIPLFAGKMLIYHRYESYYRRMVFANT